MTLLYLKRRKLSRTDILLTGLCDSGKSLTFVQLIVSEFRETFTSIEANSSSIVLEKGPFRLVDIPGHERLRNKFFDSHKQRARVIVFFVDSETLQKEVRDVADYLYTILADNTVNSIPVIIACNKQDLALAKGQFVVKNLLEKEIGLVRQTRTSQLQSVDNSTSNNVFLGKSGRDFEFIQLSQPVEFVECSAKEPNLNQLLVTINKLI